MLNKNFFLNRGAALALPALLFVLAGCGKDTPDSYPLTGKDGAPLTAAETKAIADANDPAKKTPLTADQVKDKVDRAEKDLKTKWDTPNEAQVGIPFYPGAEPRKNKGDLALASESDNALLLTLETADSVAKVDAFYKEKLPSAQRMEDTIAGKQTVGYVDESETGRKRGVDISSEGGKTVIALIVTRTTKDAGKLPSANPSSAKDAAAPTGK